MKLPIISTGNHGENGGGKPWLSIGLEMRSKPGEAKLKTRKVKSRSIVVCTVAVMATEWLTTGRREWRRSEARVSTSCFHRRRTRAQTKMLSERKQRNRRHRPTDSSDGGSEKKKRKGEDDGGGVLLKNPNLRHVPIKRVEKKRYHRLQLFELKKWDPIGLIWNKKNQAHLMLKMKGSTCIGFLKLGWGFSGLAHGCMRKLRKRMKLLGLGFEELGENGPFLSGLGEAHSTEKSGNFRMLKDSDPMGLLIEPRPDPTAYFSTQLTKSTLNTHYAKVDSSISFPTKSTGLVEVVGKGKEKKGRCEDFAGEEVLGEEDNGQEESMGEIVDCLICKREKKEEEVLVESIMVCFFMRKQINPKYWSLIFSNWVILKELLETHFPIIVLTGRGQLKEREGRFWIRGEICKIIMGWAMGCFGIGAMEGPKWYFDELELLENEGL